MSSKPKQCETCGRDYTKMSQQASLYLTSEQVVEASHQKFSVFWERYKVLDLERPMHGDNLLACVIDFNSCNM